MNDYKDFTEFSKVKSPMEQIIAKLKGLEVVDGPAKITIGEVVSLIQKFAKELEHERAHAIVQIVTNCHSMDRIEFYRGTIQTIKKLQRDFDRE